MPITPSPTRFLGRRYREKPNVIWVLGGDVMGDVHPDVVRLLAKTLRAEDPRHLITYHPFGRTESITWFNNEPWLDFNMFQSGHSRYDQDTKSPHLYGEDNWRFVHDSYTTEPARPGIDGEPSYENIPQDLHDPTQPAGLPPIAAGTPTGPYSQAPPATPTATTP